jgi:hypothetical protein
MSTREWPGSAGPADPVSDGLARLIKVLIIVAGAIVLSPLLIPFAASRIGGDAVATKTTFWVVADDRIVRVESRVFS